MSINIKLGQLCPAVIKSIYHRITNRGTHNPEDNINEIIISQYKNVLWGYINEINFRRFLDPREIELLSKDFSFEEIETISRTGIEPNFYGNWYVLQRYAGNTLCNIPPTNLAIQHGFMWEIADWDRGKKNRKNLVWSTKIKQMYRTTVKTKDVEAIGAPFYYSESLFPLDYIEKEKKRLGRNLLAFPMHSTHFIDKRWDTSHFISILKEERERFDSVRVCVYWKDVQQGMAKVFQDNGFECVCCGHLFDQFFLDRQNTLLQICDATISNGMGAHIGYSLYLNKPHRLVPDEFELVDIEFNEGKEEMKLYQHSLNRKRIMAPFENNNDYHVDGDQIQILLEFWGEKREKEEIRTLITPNEC